MKTKAKEFLEDTADTINECDYEADDVGSLLSSVARYMQNAERYQYEDDAALHVVNEIRSMIEDAAPVIFAYESDGGS